MLSVMVAMMGIVAAAGNLVTNVAWESVFLEVGCICRYLDWTEMNGQRMELQELCDAYEGNEYLNWMPMEVLQYIKILLQYQEHL